MPFLSINPTTGKRLHSYRVLEAAQIGTALKRADAAFQLWRQTSPATRARHLRAVAKTLRRRHAELARLATVEMGKPITQSLAEVEKCASVCEFYARHGARWL